MSSPKLQKHSDFDVTIGRELQSWAARQQPPADARARLLEAAASESHQSTKRPGRRSPRIVTQVQRWLAAAVPLRRKPQLPYTELSQWLFNQAMWQSLGNDRRAVRFVC